MLNCCLPQLQGSLLQFNPANYTGQMETVQERMYEYVLSEGLYSTMKILRSLQR